MLPNGVHRIEINGVDHWVRVEGSTGESIVLVHGGPGANATMLEGSVGPHLAESARVVYYDQRGCGRSGPASSYSMAALVADLNGLRSALGLDRLNLAGFSFGGQLVAEYAVAHPDRVARMVLVAPPILGPLRWDNRLAGMDAVAGTEFRARLRAFAGDAGFALGEPAIGVLRPLWEEMDDATGARFSLHDPAAPRPPALPAGEGVGYNRDFGLAIGAEQRAGSLLDDLAELDVPTLVIVGLYDRNVGVDACRDIVDRMRDARLALMMRSAHAPIEEPAEYAAVMTAFLVS
jgi:proline iminopeptidase